MIAEELINHMIPPLKPSDEAKKAIVWMEELRSNQLPVVDNGKFLGFISEEIILESNNLDASVSEFELIGKNCIVHRNQHFYDIIKISADNKVQIVVVLDDDESFFGVITLQDTVTSFAQTVAVQAQGGILVLSMNATDYSLSEIARLIESNDAKVLSCSIREDSYDKNKIKLTLKINQQDLSRIIATLERFDYKVIAQYEEVKKPVDDQKERLDILLKYLDI